MSWSKRFARPKSIKKLAVILRTMNNNVFLVEHHDVQNPIHVDEQAHYQFLLTFAALRRSSADHSMSARPNCPVNAPQEVP